MFAKCENPYQLCTRIYSYPQLSTLSFWGRSLHDIIVRESDILIQFIGFSQCASNILAAKYCLWTLRAGYARSTAGWSLPRVHPRKKWVKLRVAFKCTEPWWLQEASGCCLGGTCTGFPGPVHLSPLYLPRQRFDSNFILRRLNLNFAPKGFDPQLLNHVNYLSDARW